MQIIDGRLHDGAGKVVRFVRANAHGGAMTPRYIIIHDTAGRDRKFSSVEWFASTECPNSAHFVVERDGTVTQMVETTKRAWHAGESSWKGTRFLNSCSVGIEIVNPGKMDATGRAWFGPAAKPEEIEHKTTKEHGDGYWLPYSQEQIKTVTELSRALVEEYPDCNEILTHWEISPGRKIDTNPLFPLRELRKSVLSPSEPTTVAEVSAHTAEPVQPAIEAPAAPAIAQPSLVKEAAKSKSVRYLLGAGLAWIETKMQFVKGMLPDAQKETSEVVEPLTALGGLLKINIEPIIFALVLGVIVTVIYRHSRDKAEIAKLKGDAS